MVKDYNGVTDFKEYFRRLYDITERLQEDCNNDNRINEVYDIIELLQNDPSEYEMTKTVNVFQTINDKLFEIYGAKESILDFQVCINKLRYYVDVPDEKELIYQHDDGDFAQ